MKKLTSLSSTLTESWQEIRTHKLRVILGLFGVFVAVAAMTLTTAMVSLQEKSQIIVSEKNSGRIATVQISGWGEGFGWSELSQKWETISPRYNFSHASRVVEYMPGNIQLPSGVTPIGINAVDIPYAEIHRQQLVTGRWFNQGDASLVSPPVIISEALWNTLGNPSIDSAPSIEMVGAGAGKYRIIGVVEKVNIWDEEPRVWMLYDQYMSGIGESMDKTYLNGFIRIWVGESVSEEVIANLQADMKAGLSEEIWIDVSRIDAGTWGGFTEGLQTMRLIALVIGAVVLFLGVLALLNVQLVAMKQRIREIGVRRAFGATGGRVFSTIMLENVVATVLAGIVAIAVVVILLKQRPIMTWLMGSAADMVSAEYSFPWDAAVIGLVASVIAGALAGLIPAIMAVKAKVIDTIRI